jgi:phospholipase C
MRNGMRKTIYLICFVGLLSFLSGCGGSISNSSDVGSNPSNPISPGNPGGPSNPSGPSNPGGTGTTTYQLTVQTTGTGSGTISSSPSGISCGTTCLGTFPAGTVVTLTASAASTATFAGWSGGCIGSSTCTVTLNANTSVSGAFNSAAGIASINHVVILVQENRSFDNYLGELRQYWAQNGYPDQSFDGLPQFNPTTGAAPLYGPPPTNPGCNPDNPAPGACDFDTSTSVTSFHLATVCTENTSPSWDEAHNDWNPNDNDGKQENLSNALNNNGALNNGFVYTAAYDARALGMYDSAGARAMGYYDGDDLNFLYYMASNFATSDRFFNPAMSRTNINREYLMAATSGGYAYPNGTDAADTPQLKAETIFQDLQNAGITWKIYENTDGLGCGSGPTYDSKCLIEHSYISNFTFEETIESTYPQNVQPISQYFTDLQNGTLPQVAWIEPASDAGLDEHGTDSDSDAPTNVQAGEAWVESLITPLMNSSSWSSSVLFWTYDEAGGLYDHVAPQPMPSPDGIKPVDLLSGDICKDNTAGTGTCDFTWTGYRIPLVVVSPFAKKNYVDHTVADSTAILKFMETRWNLPPLTKRDAAQIDMTEFFDFNNPAWLTPPTPPAQNRGGPAIWIA